MLSTKEEKLSQSYSIYSTRRSDTYCPWETKIPQKTRQHNLYNFLYGFFLEINTISQSETERDGPERWIGVTVVCEWGKKSKKKKNK